MIKNEKKKEAGERKVKRGGRLESLASHSFKRGQKSRSRKEDKAKQ